MLAANRESFNEDEDEFESEPIRWIHIIFLPFNPVWRFLILIVVLIKCILGPFISIYSIHCNSILDKNDFLWSIKYIYLYLCDIIYALDSLLYIVHRQVEEEATRREFLPKRLCLITLDLLSLVPFYNLASSEKCPSNKNNETKMYPNILAFTEALICYRVVDYFSLAKTHTLWKLIVGYALMLLVYVNILSCFLLLMTKVGLCSDCSTGYYDWRANIIERMNTTIDDQLTMHVVASCTVLEYSTLKLTNDTPPHTYMGIVYCIVVVMMGYILISVIVVPKLFIEDYSSLKQRFFFHYHVLKIIHETKRRNPSPLAHQKVENFYALVWQKRDGLTTMPGIMTELPRHLTIVIAQDLTWTVFYHSPTLRDASLPFKRWLSQRIVLNYKLPGEMFFLEPQCHTNLYCIKSGIVQFLSGEDNVSPILSVSGGTVFGDICFFLPHLNRKVLVYCLTYCEVFYITRRDIIKALHRFPEDRRHIITSAKERIKHAKTLYNLKKNIKGLNRIEDEGLAWLKRRWWEIHDTIDAWKKTCKGHSSTSLTYKLQAEESYYHCPKYLGQLVLCSSLQWLANSMFVKVKFPWVLAPHSIVTVVWNYIVVVTALIALVFLPPIIGSLKINETPPVWFTCLKMIIDFVYLVDILISLSTAVERRASMTTNFLEIFLERCKSNYFILDVLSTAWIEHFFVLINLDEYYYAVQFNRLLKTYVLFGHRQEKTWHKDKNPSLYTVSVIFFLHVIYAYVFAYVVSSFVRFIPKLTALPFFGDICAFRTPDNGTDCSIGEAAVSILTGWLFQRSFNDYPPENNIDFALSILISCLYFLLSLYTKTLLLSDIYLKHRSKMNYYFFVRNIEKYFLHNKIHPLLLMRLKKYLVCHWKYFYGCDIIYPRLMRNVPYDIYYKLHGEIAENIIGKSACFIGAPHAMIKELARSANFLLLPMNSHLSSFGIHVKDVTWLANGVIMRSFYDNDGKRIHRMLYPGEQLTMMSLLLQKTTLGSYTAVTECEVLCINKTDFFRIIKRYPLETNIINLFLESHRESFERAHDEYFEMHKDNIKEIRMTLFMGKAIVHQKKESEDVFCKKFKGWWRSYRTDPNAKITIMWMTFRTIIAMLEITALSLQGGSGAVIRSELKVLCAAFSVITWFDIIYKMLLPYYNEKGLVITDKKKCMLHYMARGFLFDLITALPNYTIYRHCLREIDLDTAAVLDTIINAFCRFYIIIGTFNYYADSPSVRIPLIMIIKWQVVVLLTVLCSAHFFTYRCVHISWSRNYENVNLLTPIRIRDTCWLPSYFNWKNRNNLTVSELHFIYAQSLVLTQCGFLSFVLGKFHVDKGKLLLIMCFCIISTLFWYIQCISQAHLMILHNEENGEFQQGINQLYRFLKDERVPAKEIQKAIDYFKYVWVRNKGIDIQTLLNQRIGAVFQQDLSYFYFTRTMGALDTILKRGVPLKSLLSSNAYQVHFLPGQDVVREMELAPSVYIVHRGKVIVKQNGKILSVLTQGSIFGELENQKVRPSRITVRTIDYVDLLTLTIEEFQGIIDEPIRESIRMHPTSKNDYMAVESPIEEFAYNNIEYIMLHKQKIIKLPRMKSPAYLDSSRWYSRWLFFAWLICPVLTTVILLLYVMPYNTALAVSKWMQFLDIFHFAYVITEFYTLKVIVEGNKIVKQYVRLELMTQYHFWFDVLSILAPILTTYTGLLIFQFARLLRLHTLFLFHRYFVKSVKAHLAPLTMKIVLLFLLFHIFTCGWLYIACGPRQVYPVQISSFTPSSFQYINPNEWLHPSERTSGCLRHWAVIGAKVNETKSNFMVPINWRADYLLALSYIIVIYTHLNLDQLVPLTIPELYYNVFITTIMYLVDIWLFSVFISFVYVKCRQHFNYDYNIKTLLKYLARTGVSEHLLNAVKKYSRVLWKRQRGCWLPEITTAAPPCLREDILSALYIHHLEGLPIFKNFPLYFLRQLAAKLGRVVVFPNNNIIQEGDIFPCIYFVHEGEIEKWYTDASGENRLITILGSNSYFGVIPGLFPEWAFKFTYRSRTVVDLVYLKYDDWKDLLNGYPDLKADLYEEANKLKKRQQ